ncbi:MAG TPA: hypothetical protein VF587_09760 [Solirubrobacteraceae bacterium]|jgi:opacity protein-like surface antigen
MKTLLLAAAVVAALLVPTAATAVVPPKNCGTITVSGKRFQVKVDQISCASGKRYAKRYISRHRKPSGYKCQEPSKAKGRVNFYCNNGRKIFFGIRR